MFYLDVAYICNGFQVFSGVFASVSDSCFNVSSISRRMLQVLHQNISNVDRSVAHVVM